MTSLVWYKLELPYKFICFLCLSAKVCSGFFNQAYHFLLQVNLWKRHLTCGNWQLSPVSPFWPSFWSVQRWSLESWCIDASHTNDLYVVKKTPFSWAEVYIVHRYLLSSWSAFVLVAICNTNSVATRNYMKLIWTETQRAFFNESFWHDDTAGQAGVNN